MRRNIYKQEKEGEGRVHRDGKIRCKFSSLNFVKRILAFPLLKTA